MKKIICLALMTVCFTICSFAAEPLSERFPAEYEQLVNAVYETTHSYEELQPLFDRAISVRQPKGKCIVYAYARNGVFLFER